MLAIHWSPVKNTKKILKNGIRKSKNGLYCFPLTGHRDIDKLWIKIFKHGYNSRIEYNGFIFRIEQSDMPAYFGHWCGADTSSVFTKEINELNELTMAYRNTVLWRIGEKLFNYDRNKEKYFIQVANERVNRGAININSILNDFDDIKFVFEEYQIVLSNSIAPKRIIKIVSGRNEYGKILHKNNKNKEWKEKY